MHLSQEKAPVSMDQCNATDLYPNGYWLVPDRFQVTGQEGRINGELRGALRRANNNPAILLTEAAQAYQNNDQALGNALTDLCVTGRNIYRQFTVLNPDQGNFPRGFARNIISTILNRAYSVIWALHGYGNRNDRYALGWIAVCGEDDHPYRPVNVPGPIAPTGQPYMQHDLDVNVRGTSNSRGRDVSTRFIVTRVQNRRNFNWRTQVRERQIPRPAPIIINPDDRLLIYIHGHSARLEGALNLAEAAAENGFIIISMDLPCCGYASMFDHTELADDAYTDTLERFPLLEFQEQFVIDFIYALERRFGRDIRHQISAIVGGSLGGNLGLRLAKRSITGMPFLSNVVSWSAASVWSPLTGLINQLGPESVRAKMREDPPAQIEQPGRRADYFEQVFNESFSIIRTIVKPQPEYWYRDNWPCKNQSIAGAHADRQEIYNSSFRRWHWRVALEQLLFSHRSPEVRYQQIRARILFLSGKKDNDSPFTEIFSFTKTLADLMLTTPGSVKLLRETGHSIHAERPNELARLIAEFLPPIRPNENTEETWSGWQNLKGIFTSKPAIAMHENGRLEIVARGTDNRLWHLRQTQLNGEWGNSWEALQQGLNDRHVMGTNIAAGINQDGRLEIFSELNPGNGIAHIWQSEANANWGNWSGGLIGGTEDAVAVIERVYPDTRRYLLVAARRTNGRIHIRQQNSHGGWSNGQDLPERNSPGFVGNPAMVYNQDGRVDIFVRDRFNFAQHIWEERQGQWSRSWSRINGGNISSDIAAVLDRQGRINVFACRTNGNLLSATQRSPNRQWQSWRSLGGSLAGNATPAVAVNGWGETQVFVRWQDGSIRYRRQQSDAGFRWSEWQNLGAYSEFDPVVAANADGTLTVFTIGNQGQGIYINRQGSTSIRSWVMPNIIIPDIQPRPVPWFNGTFPFFRSLDNDSDD